MKMFLTTDEWYPVYGLSTKDRPYLNQLAVDVPPELLEEWLGALQLFEAVQEKLDKLPYTRVKAIEKLW